MKYFKLFVLFGVLGLSQASIDSELLQALSSGGRSDVLVDFNGENHEAIQKISQRSFRSRLNKVKALSTALHSLADRSQGGVQSYLKDQGVQSTTFWSSNQMVIKNAPLSILQSVDGFKEVSRIQKLPKVELEPTPEGTAPQATNVEWGIAKVRADKVWEQYGTTGEGVIVANIDTGVRGTHEALAGNWREDHGWFDPYTGTELPDDGNGHGTHTMGTIAGQGGIGVAPGATWIACRGCNSQSCGSEQLLACGQWMLAPTNPDGTDERPDLIPDIVSNSWGSSLGGSNWYNATIDAWTAAGILHTFAIGNAGPRCSSAGSPGDQPSTFSVGSTDVKDQLSIFSSKGPAGGWFSFNRYTKPDVAAPGSDVRSAWYDADDSYSTISGTSMATPHVAGIMALQLSAYRTAVNDNSAKLLQSTVVDILEETAVTKNLTLSTMNRRCDGFFFGKDRYPNNQFGHGRVDALAAVEATIEEAQQI